MKEIIKRTESRDRLLMIAQSQGRALLGAPKCPDEKQRLDTWVLRKQLEMRQKLMILKRSDHYVVLWDYAGWFEIFAA
jgi:hypothetical protein